MRRTELRNRKPNCAFIKGRYEDVMCVTGLHYFSWQKRECVTKEIVPCTFFSTIDLLTSLFEQEFSTLHLSPLKVSSKVLLLVVIASKRTRTYHPKLLYYLSIHHGAFRSDMSVIQTVWSIRFKGGGISNEFLAFVLVLLLHKRKDQFTAYDLQNTVILLI